MNTISKTGIVILSLMIGIADFNFDSQIGNFGGFTVGEPAEARPGRRVDRRSVAGVAHRSSRRTARRVMRRGAFYNSIPTSCVYGSYNGYNVYNCGGTYYQKSGSGYVIVYFN